jgi:hypothetical protein
VLAVIARVGVAVDGNLALPLEGDEFDAGYDAEPGFYFRATSALVFSLWRRGPELNRRIRGGFHGII